MLDPDESLLGAEPAEAWRGIMGTGVDWTGRTLATCFSSVRGGGRLSRKVISLLDHVLILKTRVLLLDTLANQFLVKAFKSRKPFERQNNI